MRYDICHVLFNSTGKLPPLMHELVLAGGKQLDVLVRDVHHEDHPELPPLGSNIHRRTLRLWLRRVSTRQDKILKFARYVEYVLRSFILILSTRSRIVVAHDLASMIPAYFAARLSGRSIIYHAHEIYGEMDESAAPFQSLWRKLDRFFCPRVERMICPEENRARIYLEEYNAHVLPLVVHNYPLRRERVIGNILRERLGIPQASEKLIVLYQGLLDESRCVLELVRAMPLVDENIILVLIGRGSESYRNILSEEIRTSGLTDRAFLLAHVSYRELHAITCSADIGVLLYRNSSRNNYYCAPNKIYEYFQAGLPVVASRFPGMEAIVEGRRLGVCVEPDSPRSIAEGLRRISSDTLWKDFARHAETVAKTEFSAEREHEKLFSLYDATGRD